MEIIEKQVEKVKEVPADNYGYNFSKAHPEVTYDEFIKANM